MKKIGILGGTFNPIHNGHIAIAERAKEQYLLDCVIFLPNYIPPHKTFEGDVSAEDRLLMVKAAIKDKVGFLCSDFEIKKCDVSYTVDTLKAFKGMYADSELYFIIGGDSLKGFPTWVMPDEISKLCTLIVYPRCGIDLLHCKEYAETTLGTRILLMDGADYSISSTELRDKLVSGEDVSEHIPSGVMDIIIKKSLYKK